jgi:hypothetical protein
MVFIFHFLVLTFVLLLSCSEENKLPHKEDSPQSADGKGLQENVSLAVSSPATIMEIPPDPPQVSSEEITGEAEGPLLSENDPVSEYKEGEKEVRGTQRLESGAREAGGHFLNDNDEANKSRGENNIDISRFDLPEEETVPLGLGEPFFLPETPVAKKVFSGIKKETFEDGTLKRESHYLEGKKHGPYTVWYENGGMQKKGWMKDDRWHGTYQEWWSEGELKVKGAYFEGMQNGAWRFFDTDGNALPTLYFDMGKEVTRDLKKLRSH